jgi:hypothetical protein
MHLQAMPRRNSWVVSWALKGFLDSQRLSTGVSVALGHRGIWDRPPQRAEIASLWLLTITHKGFYGKVVV